MAWAASSISIIAEQGWGAILFAAIGITFVLALMARALLPILVYFRPPPPPPRARQSMPPSVVNENAGRIQMIESALSHLIWIEGMQISKEILTRWIEDAPIIPETHEHDGLDINLLQSELSSFNEYLKHAGIELSNMPFVNDYRSIILNAAGVADTELVNLGNSPSDLPPYKFREWFIARNKVRRLLEFMKRKKLELDGEMVSYLGTLHEQKHNIETKGNGVPLDRRDVVLGALAAAGENVTFSPAQVQKLVFLIDRNAAQHFGGPHFSFRPYDYGPFDSAVYDQLTELSFEGKVDVTGTGRYRLYSLTSQGFQEGSRVLAGMAPEIAEYLRNLATWVRSLSFQQLVSAIYQAYPDMKVNSIFRGWL